MQRVKFISRNSQADQSNPNSRSNRRGSGEAQSAQSEQRQSRRTKKLAKVKTGITNTGKQILVNVKGEYINWTFTLQMLVSESLSYIYIYSECVCVWYGQSSSERVNRGGSGTAMSQHHGSGWIIVENCCCRTLISWRCSNILLFNMFELRSRVSVELTLN